jgi:hypothetical protein
MGLALHRARRECEHAFVSVQGSANARFRRALLTGNPTIVSAAAAELGTLSLSDALGVCLVFAPHDSARFERAAVRWQARYCLEQRPAADEAQLVAAALRALPGPAGAAGAEALLELCEARELRDAAAHIERWVRSRA